MVRHIVLAPVLLLLALAVAACGADGAPFMPTASPTAPAAVERIPRPVVITTDMGLDDLLAIYVLLRDPSVDIRAIAIDGTGLVHCGPGVRNLRRILAAFDRSA